VRSDLKFPPDLAKALSIYLLVAIGAIVAALGLGFGPPIVANVVLSLIVRIDCLNAAAIAAHCGVDRRPLLDGHRHAAGLNL
jgi:hypothetical protein